MVSKLFFMMVGIMLTQLTFAQNTIFSGTQIYDYNQNNYKQVDETYASLSDKVKTFKVFEIPLQQINDYVYTNLNEPDFILHLSESYHWQFNLKLHNMYAPDYRKSTQKNNKKRAVELKSPKPFTFRASVNNDETNISTLSIKQDLFIANIIENDAEFYVEPLSFYIKNAPKNYFVVYEAGATKAILNEVSCSQGHLPLANAKAYDSNSNLKTAMEVCAELAIAYDQSFKNFYGSASAAETMLATRANAVAAFYNTNFLIDFKIIEFYEAAANEITPDNNTTPCQEVFPDCSDGTILDDFREWGESENDTNSGFTSNPDVATFFTGRGVTKYYGYSHFAGICNERGYHWVEEDVPYTESRKTNLWIHEMGHTWNASHTSDVNNMMYSDVSTANPMTVANSSTNSITTHKDSRACLDAGYCEAVTAPIASFDSQIDNCNKLVQFNDNSTNTPQSWLWDFGNGNTSTMKNPSHTYFNDGTYTVVLTTSNNLGSSSFTQVIALSEEGCIDCIPLLSISQPVASGIYNKAEKIECNTIVNDSTNVGFIAGNNIILNSNFNTPATTNFSASIVPCKDICDEGFGTFLGPYFTASTDPFGTYSLNSVTLTIDASNSNRLVHTNFYGWPTADGNPPVYFDLDCTNNTITVPSQNYTTPSGYALTINGGSGTYNFTNKRMEIIFNVTNVNDGDFTITEVFTP